MGAGKAKACVCGYVHKEVNAHLWLSTLLPSQESSAWEVELGDQGLNLRPRELRVASVYLLSFIGIGAGLDGSDFGFLR